MVINYLDLVLYPFSVPRKATVRHLAEATRL